MLTESEGERVTLESRYDFLRDPASEPLAYFLDRPGVQKLHLAMLDLETLRAGLGTRLGPKHPQMVEIGRQASEIGAQLQAEVSKEVAGVRAQFDAARVREERLHGKLDRMQVSAIALRDLGTHYDLLKSDLETATSLHQSLLKQQMETAVNSALGASNVRVIERPEVPTRPATPNVPLNLTLGLLVGVVGALGATLVCEHFDNSVKSSEEVEGLLQLPALATIPNFALARRGSPLRALTDQRPPAAGGVGPRAQIVVLTEPMSPVAEAFRSLRTAVLFSAPAAPPKMVLVTSAGAGEGKTVSSLNLATSLAEAGSRVLLIDVDLRKPSCHRALGIDNDRGLSSYLAGQSDLAGVTRQLATPRLFFIPAGPTPPNPAELVGSKRMRDALAEMRDAYDFVIVDSPPVIPVTDAVVLSREADGVLLVVKGHDTPRELVRRARDQLQQSGARLLGAVVNNVDLGWGDMYFYNRYYGYYHAPAPAEQGAV
jgi:capsular exopolysaccharide synthesis family protein